MSSLKLKHSGGNAVSLNPPTSAPTSADVAFKLPNADGSANQLLKTDGSGNLGWATDQGGKFASYAMIADQKTQSTNGGTFTSGAWRTRDLNTELADADGIVSISSNKFTLQAGTYLVIVSAPAYKVTRHSARLMNDTDGTAVAYGTNASCSSDLTRSIVIARFTITGAKEFLVSHHCQDDRSNDGFGINVNDQWSVPSETYTFVEIYKEA
mgnify:CR=1 FL=1|tara:strand:+ start:410 stop:1042 length:633 start_codon:yes stop_codon:yes gene_type:complete